MIPKIITFVWWQGKDKIPEANLENINKWKLLNPEWRVQILDKDDISRLIYRRWPDLFQFYKNIDVSNSEGVGFQNMRHVDFSRPLIAEFYGGLVVDVDMIPVRPIESFLSDRLQYFREDREMYSSMMEDIDAHTEPLDLSDKRLILFYDFDDSDGNRCVAPGFILCDKNNGICQWFSRWSARTYSRGEDVLNSFGPRKWKEFLNLLLSVNPRCLKRVAIMSNYYIWWHKGLIEGIGDVPDWALAWHECDHSWFDHSLKKPWEAK